MFPFFGEQFHIKSACCKFWLKFQLILQKVGNVSRWKRGSRLYLKLIKTNKKQKNNNSYDLNNGMNCICSPIRINYGAYRLIDFKHVIQSHSHTCLFGVTSYTRATPGLQPSSASHPSQAGWTRPWVRCDPISTSRESGLRSEFF